MRGCRERSFSSTKLPLSAASHVVFLHFSEHQLYIGIKGISVVMAYNRNGTFCILFSHEKYVTERQ